MRTLDVLSPLSDLQLVVLGGDTPHGTPLVLDLERKGYIVLASVATPKAVDPLEQKSQGYVCALVLDPSMVSFHVTLARHGSHLETA